MLHSTETAAGLKEVNQIESVTLTLLKKCHRIDIDDEELALWIYISPHR